MFIVSIAVSTHWSTGALAPGPAVIIAFKIDKKEMNVIVIVEASNIGRFVLSLKNYTLLKSARSNTFGDSLYVIEKHSYFPILLFLIKHYITRFLSYT